MALDDGSVIYEPGNAQEGVDEDMSQFAHKCVRQMKTVGER